MIPNGVKRFFYILVINPKLQYLKQIKLRIKGGRKSSYTYFYYSIRRLL